MVKYAKQLAQQMGADEEIIEISAWLHDIKKIQGIKDKHHVYGSEQAAELLTEWCYDSAKIERVKKCILTHSSDKFYPPQSLEERILATADALSHFDNFLALTYMVYNLKNYSMEEGRVWLINKYKTCWDKLNLIPEAKEIVKPKYDAIKLFLGEQN